MEPHGAGAEGWKRVCVCVCVCVTEDAAGHHPDQSAGPHPRGLSAGLQLSPRQPRGSLLRPGLHWCSGALVRQRGQPPRHPPGRDPDEDPAEEPGLLHCMSLYHCSKCKVVNCEDQCSAVNPINQINVVYSLNLKNAITTMQGWCFFFGRAYLQLGFSLANLVILGAVCRYTMSKTDYNSS